MGIPKSCSEIGLILCNVKEIDEHVQSVFLQIKVFYLQSGLTFTRTTEGHWQRSRLSEIACSKMTVKLCLLSASCSWKYAVCHRSIARLAFTININVEEKQTKKTLKKHRQTAHAKVKKSTDILTKIWTQSEAFPSLPTGWIQLCAWRTLCRHAVSHTTPGQWKSSSVLSPAPVTQPGAAFCALPENVCTSDID